MIGENFQFICQKITRKLFLAIKIYHESFHEIKLFLILFLFFTITLVL